MSSFTPAPPDGPLNGRLYRELHELVRGFIKRSLGVPLNRDESLVEEGVQRVFIALALGLARGELVFPTAEHFRNYLSKIAARVACTLKVERWRASQRSGKLNEDAVSLHVVGASYDDRVLHREILRRIKATRETLSESDRRLLDRLMAEEPPQEIAVATGQSPETVRVGIHRLRKKLRGLIPETSDCLS